MPSVYSCCFGGAATGLLENGRVKPFLYLNTKRFTHWLASKLLLMGPVEARLMRAPASVEQVGFTLMVDVGSIAVITRGANSGLRLDEVFGNGLEG